METELLTLFKGANLSKLTSALSGIARIVEDFQEDYATDQSDLKNAAIDTLIQILQAHKDVLPPK